MSDASSVLLNRRNGLWRKYIAWFSDTPVTDPVDRRNAPMLVLLLSIIAIAPPLAWAYRILLSEMPWRKDEALSLAFSLAISATAAVGVMFVRRGHFRTVTRSFLAVIAAAMLLSHIEGGLAAQTHEMPLHVIWIVVAGLILGRAALWAMFACSFLAMSLGFLVDALGARGGGLVLSDEFFGVVISVLILLLLAIVIDRSVSALRETLAEVRRGHDALSLANQQLKTEIAERESAQERLIHAQKVEAVGRLASGVTHDFNNFLGLILSFSKRASRETDSPAIQKALSGIDAAARRATALCRKLLNFSRSDVAHVEVFDVATVLEDIKPMLIQLFDPEIIINLEFDSGQNWILFDRPQFELVILNFAANANDAMRSGGRFHLSVETVAHAGNVRITVSDNGVGMTPEVKEKAFDVFFTTKPPGQGTGLGLAVTKDLIVAAGGSVAVESAIGKGSRFVVELPLATRLI